MQQRIRAIQSGHELTLQAPFYVSSFDDQASGLFPNIEDEEQQARYILGIPDDVHLVVLDSLSTLAALEESNDAKSWGPVQRMLLALRRRGISAIVVHHANKGGTDQLGTSRRIHVMDTVISLRPHEAAEGATPGHKDVEVHVTKGRNLPPNIMQPHMATLAGSGDGAMAWESGDLTLKKGEQVEELLRLGVNATEVIKETGASHSFVYRIRDRLRQEGMQFKSSKRGPKRRDIDD